MKRRIGILLTGCGSYDGTDPQEAILSMLAVQEAGAEVVPMALDVPQFHVVDHLTAQEVESATRNCMEEAARLVRGKLYKLEEISPKLLDGLIIPGGQGPAKSLLTGFGTDQPRKIVPAVLKFITEARAAGTVFGAISLGEFVLADAFGPWPDGKGCFDLPPTGLLVDREHHRVLTPGYTLCSGLPELLAGIRNFVEQMLTLINEIDR